MFKTSDSEVIAQLLSQSISLCKNWIDAIMHFMNIAEAAYSLLILCDNTIYAFKDRYGFRPLCIGEVRKNNDKNVVESVCISSESCALQTIGATYIRELGNGEIIKIDAKGYESCLHYKEKIPPTFCSFEHVYFSRPDSYIQDKLVHTTRQMLGKQLAIEAPCPNADIVMGIPDSSTPAAMGYAIQSNIPYQEGLCKNRYIGRTFIQPENNMRNRGIALKYNVMKDIVKGKIIALIDDSIVRGNTLNQLVSLIRIAKPKAIHVRISSPPVRNPCHMGIDISSREELIADKKSIEDIKKHINADSLAYLSMEGMIKVLCNEKKEKTNGLCTACFDGKYPAEIDW